ncbi:carboxymuconolactone decarboxylase family protein [Megamonas sp.]|uniref:carboxymuconolactone decarboxylase family protein n=1 Tax=Megamonas sp. TaxID=2049033 RepID=UPI00258B06B4|nr:carboxymuconolactone decarboxylase family protein [Megamonas sp.]
MKYLLSILTFCSVLFLGISSSFANYQAGSLTAKQQAIIPIASYTATGDLNNLKTAVNEGLDNGLTINETKEIMVHLYAYCGFPRALNGLATVDEVLSERQSKNIHDTMGNDATPLPANTDILALGTRVQTQLAGAPVNIASSSSIDYMLKAHLFGDLFARDILTYPEREIATISALASMNGTESQLLSHLNIGINAGLNKTQLQDIINTLDTKVNTQLAQHAQETLDNYLASSK